MTTTKTTTKAATTKTATKKAESKKVEAKKTETKATKKVIENKEKVNTTIDISEITKMLVDAGINIVNPNAKGNYRIMGTKKGSSLNLQKHKYIIFSTDVDYAAVEAVKDKYQDLVLVKGGNSQDKNRPNKVEFTAIETLKAILKLYAANPVNKPAAATK